MSNLLHSFGAMEKTTSHTTQAALKESDLMTLERPPVSKQDFEVRPLDNYKPESLQLLLNAVRNEITNAVLSLDDKRELDVWCYRIRDARKSSLYDQRNQQKPNKSK